MVVTMAKNLTAGDRVKILGMVGPVDPDSGLVKVVVENGDGQYSDVWLFPADLVEVTESANKPKDKIGFRFRDIETDMEYISIGNGKASITKFSNGDGASRYGVFHLSDILNTIQEIREDSE